jgi:hypothetical protein
VPFQKKSPTSFCLFSYFVGIRPGPNGKRAANHALMKSPNDQSRLRQQQLRECRIAGNKNAAMPAALLLRLRSS